MRIAGPHLIAIIILYVALCGFFLYFCMFADPETSDMAYLLQVAFPSKSYKILKKGLGEEKMSFVQELMNRFLVFVYLFIVLGCWTVVFWYIYPWISTSSNVSNVHKYIGYIVFVSCFGSWRKTNKSSPGFITARSFKRYDHYPYDPFLFVPNRRCETTNLIRIPRSKCT